METRKTKTTALLWGVGAVNIFRLSRLQLKIVPDLDLNFILKANQCFTSF